MSTKLRTGSGPFKNSSGDTVGTINMPTVDIGTLTYNDGSQIGLYYPVPCNEQGGCGYILGQGPHPQDRLMFECLQTDGDGHCVKWFWRKERETPDGHGGYTWESVANQTGTYGPLT